MMSKKTERKHVEKGDEIARSGRDRRRHGRMTIGSVPKIQETLLIGLYLLVLK
jgi:hypothetical protein